MLSGLKAHTERQEEKYELDRFVGKEAIEAKGEKGNGKKKKGTKA